MCGCYCSQIPVNCNVWILLSEFDERIFWTSPRGCFIIRLTRDLLVFLPSGQTEYPIYIQNFIRKGVVAGLRLAVYWRSLSPEYLL